MSNEEVKSSVVTNTELVSTIQQAPKISAKDFCAFLENLKLCTI